jgi:hypothetical protein
MENYNSPPESGEAARFRQQEQQGHRLPEAEGVLMHDGVRNFPEVRVYQRLFWIYSNSSRIPCFPEIVFLEG